MSGALGYIPRNGRRDANEVAIARALRQAGADVWPLSGTGIPDLLVGFRRQWFALEVKSAKGTLRPAQRTFLLLCESRELPVAVVRTAEEALRAVGAIG